jgi:hypothetical protein
LLSCPITRWQRNAFKKPNQKRNTQFKAFSYLSFKNNSALASYLHICGWRWDSHDDVTNKSTCLRCSPAPFLSMVLLANSVFLPPLCVLSHLPLHFVFVSRHIRCKKQARDHHRHAVGSSSDMVTYYSRVVDAWVEKRIR